MNPRNKFNHDDSKYFLKQAIYYINGSAEVGFDPENIEYNLTSKSITLNYSGTTVFDLYINAEHKLLDLIDPEPIGSDEAAKMSAVVGVAGAVTGGVIGNNLSSMIGTILPPGAKLASSTIGVVGGAALGGVGAAYLTFSTLDGLHLSKAISEGERNEVVSNALSLIKALMLADPELEAIFKANFEAFIKDIYLSRGLEVGDIIYKRVKK